MGRANRQAPRGRAVRVAGFAVPALAVGLGIYAVLGRESDSHRIGDEAIFAEMGRLLFRPLDRGPDARCGDGLPPLVPLPSGGDTAPALDRAAERIRALYEAVADPTDVAAFLDANERLLWIGMGGGVEEAGRAVLARIPDQPRALAVLAAVRYEAGLRDEIAPLCEAALRGNPDETLALVFRAVVREQEGKRVDALADLERAAAAAPRRPEPAHFLGRILFDRRRFSEAAAHLAKAIPHEPDERGRVPFVRLVLAYRDLFEGRRPFDAPREFEAVEVPIVRKPDLPAVEVVVNGKRRGWMQIDTGSETTRIPRREAALAERREGAALETGAFDSSRPRHAPGRVRSIEIGGLVVREVPVLVELEEHAPPAEGVLGAIGTDFLAQFAPTIDLLGSKLRLEPAGRGSGIGFSGEIRDGVMLMGSLPFTRVGNTMHVRAALGAGPPLEFLFDTGANAVTLDRAILRERFGVSEGDPGTTPVWPRGIAGRSFTSFLFPLPVPLVIANTPVHGLSVVAEDLARSNSLGRRRLAGTLGLPLLSSMTLAIDFDRQEIQYVLTGAPARGR